MIKLNSIKRWVAAVAAGAALCGALTTARAATYLTSTYLNSFDDSTTVASWIYWYGLGFNNTPMTWDPTMDATTNANSGSLQVVAPFGASGDQAVFFGTFDNKYGYDNTVLLDGTLYDRIEMDVRVDPSTPTTTNGDFGTLLIGMVDSSTDAGGYYYGSGQIIPGKATNQWVHIVQPIDKTTPNLNICEGVDFKIASYGGYPKAPFTMWIDNLTVHQAPPAAPPSMKPPIAAKSGLNLFSNGTDQYQRTGLEAINPNFVNMGWVGSSTPVSYSITITDYPPQPMAVGYQTHIIISSDNPPVYRTAPDYSSTNVIFFDIQGTANGGQGNFRYKINEPNSNANVYAADNGTAGTLASLAASSILGTWTMTFSANTNVTVTGPGGVSTNFTISATAAAQFDEANLNLNPTPLSVYIGAQPNNTASVGQRVVVGGFQMTGNAGAFSDTFTAAALDTTTWRIVTENQGTAIYVSPDPAIYAQWSVPDAGFGLQSATQLLKANNVWTTLTGTNSMLGPFSSVVLPTGKVTLIPFSAIGSTNIAFFRLISGQ